MKDFRVFREVSYDFNDRYKLLDKDSNSYIEDIVEIVFANNGDKKRVSVSIGEYGVLYKDLEHIAAWDEFMVLCSMTNQRFTPGYFERNKYVWVG